MAAKVVDPFHAARDHVKSLIENCKKNHEKYQDVIRNTNTAINKEYMDIRRVITKDIRAAEGALKMLKESVDKIDEVQIKKFDIKKDEIDQRKQWVEKAVKAIKKVKEGLDSEAVRKKLDQDVSKNKRQETDDVTQSLINEVQSENENFVKRQKKQQKQLIKQQDQNLGLLEKSLDSLQNKAVVIKDEIKSQSKELDELGNEIDKGNERIGSLNEALQKLLNTKDGCQIMTIVILAVILIVLVCLVIWV